MKKTKANAIKILAAMRDNARDCAKSVDNDPEFAKRLRQEANAFQAAIWLLTDYDNSFEGYGKIYFPDEFPNK